MKQAFSSHLSTLITCLKSAGIDWDGENIADLLWLANYIDVPQSNEIEPESEEPEPEVVQVERDTTPLTPLPQTSEFSLFSQTNQQTKTQKTKAPQSGIPFQTPTAPALRNTLDLGRSLRPLMRRIDSYTQTVLDEEATVEQTAERQFCMTMVRPARERWLELAIVIEDSASSFLWRDNIRDFQQVLERQGAFRTVTVWYLQTSAAGATALYAQRPELEAMPRPRDPKGLIDASGRRLILVISDCISPAWQQGRLQKQYLAPWAKHGPLAILQMLPSYLWSRTVLSAGLQTTFSARVPGVPNAQLVDPLPSDFYADYAPGLKLPVITLEPSSMSQWARVVAGFGETQTAGIWFSLADLSDGFLDESAEQQASSSLSESGQPSQDEMAELLVNRFSQTASYTARELASLMALVPVELPLIYIIQAKLLPDSSPLHVAEVFLSGLVERVHDDSDRGAKQTSYGSLFATQRRYQFVSGVRDLLTDTVRTDSAEEILNELSIYIGNKLGKSIYNFMALLRLKDELEMSGSEFLEFANVTKQALRRLGGQYAELVEAVEQEEVFQQVVPPSPTQYPDLQVLEFFKGELIDSAAEPVVEYPQLQTATFQIATVSVLETSLETFEFQVVFLEHKRIGKRRRPSWVVEKSLIQGSRFYELLSEDVFLEMMAVPGDSFLMGSPVDEPQRRENEGPQHEVTVPAFLMGRYPVTQAQWRLVASLPQVNRELKLEPSRFEGDERPVENVSWYEAVEFCDRISQHTGRTYRLPTEAEWEYACRAGSTTPFHFGSTLTQEIANYDASRNYNDGPKGQESECTTPVGQFDSANAFGLSDMHGNVLEWCQDIWHDNYDGAPTDGSAWTEGVDSDYRILHGGSWIYYPEYCRSARRYNSPPEYRINYIGFRVVSAPPRSLL